MFAYKPTLRACAIASLVVVTTGAASSVAIAQQFYQQPQNYLRQQQIYQQQVQQNYVRQRQLYQQQIYQQQLRQQQIYQQLQAQQRARQEAARRAHLEAAQRAQAAALAKAKTSYPPPRTTGIPVTIGPTVKAGTPATVGTPAKSGSPVTFGAPVTVGSPAKTAAPVTTVYTFSKTPSGTIETFKNGQRIGTSTADYATQQFGYKPLPSTPPPAAAPIISGNVTTPSGAVVNAATGKLVSPPAGASMATATGAAAQGWTSIQPSQAKTGSVGTPVAPATTVYTFVKTPTGNVETFKNGQRIATSTADYATQQFGYRPLPSAPPPPAAMPITSGNVTTPSGAVVNVQTSKLVSPPPAKSVPPSLNSTALTSSPATNPPSSGPGKSPPSTLSAHSVATVSPVLGPQPNASSGSLAPAGQWTSIPPTSANSQVAAAAAALPRPATASRTYICPVQGTCANPSAAFLSHGEGYLPAQPNKFHLGADLPVQARTPVFAPVSGEIVYYQTKPNGAIDYSYSGTNFDAANTFVVIRERDSGREHILGHVTCAVCKVEKFSPGNTIQVQRGQAIGVVLPWSNPDGTSRSHVHWAVNNQGIVGPNGELRGNVGASSTDNFGQLDQGPGTALEAQRRGWIDPLRESWTTRPSDIPFINGVP